MFTVRFTQKSCPSSFRPVIFKSPDVETCLKMALGLHEISNVPHCISVHQESDQPKIFRDIVSLELSPSAVKPFDGEAPIGAQECADERSE